MSGPPVPETVAVLGGTFDPVHLGHLRLAAEARRLLGLCRTLLLPAALAPHKGGLSAARHREAMLRLALLGQEGLEISRLELATGSVCYTIDTLRRLRGGSPPLRPVFLLGMDALAQIHTWRSWHELLCEFDLAAADRPGGTAGAEPLRAEVASRIVRLRASASELERVDVGRGGRILLLPLDPVPVSSSAVRARVRAGGELGQLVPPAVGQYIHELGLYRKEEHR